MVVDVKTLRKVMGVVPPALMMKGPWGLGGWHAPNKGKVYSPPTGEATVSMARCSPNLEGSKVTSRATSVPPVEPGAAATVLSTWKSGESTWWRTQTSVTEPKCQRYLYCFTACYYYATLGSSLGPLIATFSYGFNSWVWNSKDCYIQL